jgi:hypothetical protein
VAGTGLTINRPGGSNGGLLSSLEPDQLTGAKRERLPRRRLKNSEVLLLWGVRVYLLVMMGVVVYQLWTGSR